MKKWPSDTLIENLVFDAMDYWFKVQGLPPELITTQNIQVTAARVGEVLEIESKTDLLPKIFQRPKSLVRINTHKLLRPIFLLKKKDGMVPPLWNILNLRN